MTFALKNSRGGASAASTSLAVRQVTRKSLSTLQASQRPGAIRIQTHIQPRRKLSSQEGGGSAGEAGKPRRPTKEEVKARSAARREALARVEQRPKGQLQVVATAAKTGANYLVVAAGASLFAVFAYGAYSALFGTDTTNDAYGDSINRLRSDPRITAALGSPIQGSGVRHLRATTEKRDGVNWRRMQYSIGGPRGQAVVYVESNVNDPSDYHYLIVQFANKTPLHLIDKRATDRDQVSR